MRARVIPCLTLKDGGLVKTKGFRSPSYIGDPINAVRIYTDSEVDELIVLDISASLEGRAPDVGSISEIVSEAFMPVGYGGGVSSVAIAEKILEIGVEKIVVNSSAMMQPSLINKLAKSFGSQAVVASVDVRVKMFGGHEVIILGGTKKTGRDPLSVVRELVEAGAGEIMLTSIDRDGTRAGYDLNLIRSIAGSISVPLIACGGAGSLDHLVEAVEAGASAVAAGSLFVHHGPHRGVLINYPSRATLEEKFR